jgi:hypothetical protein
MRRKDQEKAQQALRGSIAKAAGEKQRLGLSDEEFDRVIVSEFRAALLRNKDQVIKRFGQAHFDARLAECDEAEKKQRSRKR